MKKRMTIAPLMLALALSPAMLAQNSTSTMDKVYADESHCLLGPEIRREQDNAISCYCRDALVDVHYVYFNYFLKDQNLSGVVLALESLVRQQCGANYNVVETGERDAWKWNGPEVVRTYPSDSEIARITPDSNGFRVVEYKVRLAYHDKEGRTTRVETFATRAPLDFAPTTPALRESPRER